MATAVRFRTAWRRNTRLARLGARVGLGQAGTSARKLFAGAERRERLSRERELKTAQQVAAELGNMKGALMKLGQMASYLDDGLPEPMRMALAQLQSQAPPMSIDLVHGVIREEFGREVGDLFVEFDDEPIAAASIGQVHRAIMRCADVSERAVAVKVQYPGVAEAIDADLRTADLLGTLLAFGFKSLNPEEMVAEIKDRLREELDYSREAENQRLFAGFYRGHPFVHVPEVIDELSTRRVLTSELVVGSTFAEVCGWSQEQRDMAGEAIFRFVFRSLYRFRAFNELLAPASLSLSEIVMAERYSWKLVLSNGAEIVVDENRWQEKMERFVQFYNKIPEAERGLLVRADLRYDNALAVKWKKKDDHPSAA